MGTKNVKKRNWAFVAYPESLPTDWKEQLQATGLQVAISPLHDRDVDPTGELKKPHYHVILCYAGPTSYNVVKGLTDSLKGPIPQPLEQVRGYYRYFTHMDNPEKYQYSPDTIETINGFSIMDFVELTYAFSAFSSPSAFFIARVSTTSFMGVPVPCALMYTVSLSRYSASRIASFIACAPPLASGWGAVMWYASQVEP